MDAVEARPGRVPESDAPRLPAGGILHGAGGTETSRADPLGTAVGDDAARVVIGTADVDDRSETARAIEITPETAIVLAEVEDRTSTGTSLRASLGAQEESREGVLLSWRWLP